MRATRSASWASSPGGGHGGLADVEVEVEVGILDPVGVVEAERAPPPAAVAAARAGAGGARSGRASAVNGS